MNIEKHINTKPCPSSTPFQSVLTGPLQKSWCFVAAIIVSFFLSIFVSHSIWHFLLSCVCYLPLDPICIVTEVITHSPCLLIQINPHVDGFHKPAISHHCTLLSGVFCFALLIWPAVILSVFCALCHGEYPYLTQLIRPFILMEFTLSPPAFSLTKTELFARVVGGVERQNASNKLLWLAGTASPRCHFPLLKVINALRVKPTGLDHEKVK